MANVKDLNLRTLNALYINSKDINTQSLTINGIPFDSTNTTSEILTSSGIIPLTNTSTFFETYKSYSLDGSQLPKFILASGIPNQQIDLNLLNPRSGNVNVKTNKGSFNLTFDNQNVDLQYINTNWVQKGEKSPWFVNEQQGLKLVGSSGIGTQEQGWTCSLSADGNTLAVGGLVDNNTKGATWIFTRSGNTWSQQGNKLIGASGTGFTAQGSSVSLSADGNTLATGGSGDNNGIGIPEGAVWIFTRSGNPASWTQQGNKLVGASGIGSVRKGKCSLSADGNTLAIGGAGDNGQMGATWIFTRSGNPPVWTQQGNKLVGSSGIGSPLQGSSVSLSADGNTLAVGGLEDLSAGIRMGATWIFTRSGNPPAWTQQGNKLVGSGYESVVGGQVWQGESVSLSADGNTLAVGASLDGNSTGATWIFTRSGSTWTQQGNKLTVLGATGGGPRQGRSVSLSADGNTLALGGPSNDEFGSNIGAVWIFTRSGTIWTQQGNRLIGSSGTISNQGYSVSLSANGNTLAVGGPFDTENAPTYIGATWVFI